MSRLEMVGETLRHALNEISKVAPKWLRNVIPDAWYERYARRFEEDYHKLTKRKDPELFTQIGSDGFGLLEMVYNKGPLEHLASLPAIETLRRCWLEQFYPQDGEVKRRDNVDMSVGTKRLDSPFETEARYSRNRKGGYSWVGYKVHLTETCDDASPHLVAHVTTTVAPVHDVSQTPIIQDALRDKQLLPAEHLVNSNYMSADLVLKYREEGTQLTGPMKANSHGQQREGGYDTAAFEIDWEQKTATCPQGKRSISWLNTRNSRSGRILPVATFSVHDCRPAP